MKPKKRKIKHFCRLYKYTCIGCKKTRHKRHYAKKNEMCETCKLYEEQLINQPKLF